METGHLTNLSGMKTEVKLSSAFRIVTGVLIAAGLAATAYGFFTDPGRTWSNYLINNFYFLSVAMGGAFFFVIQYIFWWPCDIRQQHYHLQQQYR